MSAAEFPDMAFPGLNPVFTGLSSDGQERYEIQPTGGMTLRDYFAAKAMAVFLTTPVKGENEAECIADAAYGMADEMLKARK